MSISWCISYRFPASLCTLNPLHFLPNNREFPKITRRDERTESFIAWYFYTCGTSCSWFLNREICSRRVRNRWRNRRGQPERRNWVFSTGPPRILNSSGALSREVTACVLRQVHPLRALIVVEAARGSGRASRSLELSIRVVSGVATTAGEGCSTRADLW
jgi:hypothetical protein